MTVEKALRLVAGVFVLLSLILFFFHSKYWIILTFAVGFNLLQSAFTNWCPAKSVLKLLGLKSCEEEIKELKKESAGSKVC